LKKPFGFVVIDKPIGLTSHDCVNRLRKIYGIKKIGHGGTLDPSVTGVLPIAIGNATRLICYLQGSKTYKGIIQLGAFTTTDDQQGELKESGIWPLINNRNLEKILENFRGEILQKPPVFSSVHIKGERAYKRARRGDNFDLTPKKITINDLKLINWSQQKGEIEIHVDCSSGTYIRSLARDIGAKIGCGAYLKKLRRTKSYDFTENHSVLLPEESDMNLKNKKPKILDPIDFLSHLPVYKLKSEEEIISWRSGRRINIDFFNSIDSNQIKHRENNAKNILILDQDNDIEGIAEIQEELTLKPKVVFNAIG